MLGFAEAADVAVGLFTFGLGVAVGLVWERKRHHEHLSTGFAYIMRRQRVDGETITTAFHPRSRKHRDDAWAESLSTNDEGGDRYRNRVESFGDGDGQGCGDGEGSQAT